MFPLGASIACSDSGEECEKLASRLMELTIWVRVSLISLLKSNISLQSHAKTDRLFHYFCPPLRFSVFPFSCYISIMSLNEPTSVWVEFSWEAQLLSQACWLVWVQFCQVFHICFLSVAIFAKSSFSLIIQICLLHFSCQRQIKKN